MKKTITICTRCNLITNQLHLHYDNKTNADKGKRRGTVGDTTPKKRLQAKTKAVRTSSAKPNSVRDKNWLRSNKTPKGQRVRIQGDKTTGYRRRQTKPNNKKRNIKL